MSKLILCWIISLFSILSYSQSIDAQLAPPADTFKVKKDSVDYAMKKGVLADLKYCYYKVDMTSSTGKTVLNQDQAPVNNLVRIAQSRGKKGLTVYEIRPNPSYPPSACKFKRGARIHLIIE